MNLYATRAQLKDRAGIEDSADDMMIDAVLLAVSRQIDQWCRRQFFPVAQSRLYTARSAVEVVVDDLLSVDALETDDGGDRTYATVWAASDYELGPPNARSASPPEPYWQILARPGGARAFPVARWGVRVTGTWGYYDERVRVDATLAETLTPMDTSVDVTSSAPFEVGHTIRVDDEQMYVRAVAGSTLTVTRGVNGTTAATHANGAAIDRYRYPVVSEACLLQAARLLKRADAPFGVIGAPDFGAVRIAALDPDVRMLLAPVTRAVVG